jgi:ABC-type multidrug transport system fused ATPase/permease subunit
MLKSFFKKYLSTLFYFHKYLGFRIFITMILSVFVGIIDGFGLTMFLPLLQHINNGGIGNPKELGNLSFILEAIKSSGVNLTLASVLLFMIVFFVLKGFAKYSLDIYRVILEQRFIKTLRLELLDNLNKINFEQFTKTDVGRIQNTMSGEVDRVSFSYRAYFIVYENAIMVIVYLGFAFLADSKFALLVTVGGVLTNFLYRGIYKRTIGASQKLTDETNIYQGRIIQHINNFKYLRATGLVENVSFRLKEVINRIERSKRNIGFLSAIMTAAREPLLITVVVGVISFQIYVLAGNMGAILISLLFFYRALQSLSSLQNDWNRFLAVLGSLHNMIDFQEFLRFNKKDISNVDSIEEISNLKLKNISFYYGETSILNDIDFEIVKNSSIAFVGESGSGKTTLINIICGLLTPQQGGLFINDINLQELNIGSYQKKIGYITQEPVIFSDSIFNNVALWAEPNQKNIDKFNEAVLKAHLNDFINELPDGLNTELGNNGINISGGQKQRISIARELFKDIEILIMDEATSALDSETERIIQDSIQKLQGNLTILIVAHRLFTIKNVDKVVYMNKGKVQDIDTFDNLVERHSKFRKMVEFQEI